MLQIDPKKFKKIQNKSIPSPLRPKFRDKSASNMYFLSKNKFNDKKRKQLTSTITLVVAILIIFSLFYYFAS